MNADTGSRRTRPLQDVFAAVPPRYDLVNRVITWGQDSRWRRRAAQECLGGKPGRVLDLCCGTADLALEMARLAEQGTEVMALDFSRPMLALAREKDGRSAAPGRVSYLYGDAAGLPFADNGLDCIGIAFAFRNLTYRNPRALRYLAEALRALRPGGRLVIVESSQPARLPVRRAFHLYLRGFVARVGTWISGNTPAYQLLAESAARFYTPVDLERLLLEAGFSRFASRGLMLGAVAIHTATK